MGSHLFPPEVVIGEIATDTRQRLTGQETSRTLPNDGRLSVDHRDAIIGVSERALAPTGHPAGLGGLATLPLLPLRLVLCLVPRSRPEHARDQSASRVTEVDLAGDGRQVDAVLVGEVDDVLQLPR